MLANTGELLHSKATRDEGVCSEAEAVERLLEKVREYLDSV